MTYKAIFLKVVLVLMGVVLILGAGWWYYRGHSAETQQGSAVKQPITASSTVQVIGMMTQAQVLPPQAVGLTDVSWSVTTGSAGTADVYRASYSTSTSATEGAVAYRNLLGKAGYTILKEVPASNGILIFASRGADGVSVHIEQLAKRLMRATIILRVPRS